ncbi:uncharacterized protein MICPUCDRAFT_70240 [Micromonas pusilla CCMP1545]|uniref:Predicted protein n=1 Tax=Micromonas pusilla (strain CCMP1545) TaxID=564608 RepID=C1MLQ5_MICPC|nr:uncharacterized protein MICPUCDRAFT_70240 [Micromonas pusilla CCMP1545]EEH59985.1 predicted protein [Micromonas pusilla CCMP1545]|eukprot:XP_003056609.1 predicted protein [Micromonas pusilla CCMP1545]
MNDIAIGCFQRGSFNFPDKPSSAELVAPGEDVRVGHQTRGGLLRGHGTILVSDRFTATICGTIERVGNLVSVRPFRCTYKPETGDVVLGRVIERAGKCWKLDINSWQDASLHLSAINLPGGIPRRRNADDELNMRQLYDDDDLVSAEVQSVHRDGTVMLHTRGPKYGCMSLGQLISVVPVLVKRAETHFHRVCSDLKTDIEILIGCNGYIWVGLKHSACFTHDPECSKSQNNTGGCEREVFSTSVNAHTRDQVCRVASAVRVLSMLHLAIYPKRILDVVDRSNDWGVSNTDMLRRAFVVKFSEWMTD